MWLALLLSCGRNAPPEHHDSGQPRDSGTPATTHPESSTFDTARYYTPDACQFDTCPGDPVGTWGFTLGCAGATFVGGYSAGTCFDIDRNEWQQWTGSATFSAEGAADLSISQWDYYESYVVPAHCITTDCHDPFETVYGWTCVSQQDHTCACTEHTTQTTDVTQHLEWWAVGPEIAIGRQDTSGGSTTIGTYRICRDPDWLKLEEDQFGYVINAVPQ